MADLDRVGGFVNRVLIWIAGCFLAAMIALTCSNIVLRLVWGPVRGTYELMGYFGAVMMAFALGYTQMHQGHVSIGLFINRLAPRIRAVVNTLVYLAATILFAIVTWHVFLHAGVLKQSGSLSETMKVIVYPWVYLTSLGCAGLTIALFVDFMKSCGQVFSRRAAKDKRAVSSKPKGDR